MKTTKGGKVMNPTDAYRKELRKKELKRNKRERKKVREVGILKKDPEIIREQIEKLEKMKADGALDKARKHKKRQLEDTLNVVIKKRKEYEEKMKEKGETPVMFSHLAPPRRRTSTDEEDNARHPKPEDSVYYHPTLNPTGAPPPGKPPMYKSSIGPRIPLSAASFSTDASSSRTESEDAALAPLPPPPPPPPPLPEDSNLGSGDIAALPASVPLPPPPPIPPNPAQSGLPASLPPPPLPPAPPGPPPKEQVSVHSILPPPPPPLQQSAPPPPPGSNESESAQSSYAFSDEPSSKDSAQVPSVLPPPPPLPPGMPGNQLESGSSEAGADNASVMRVNSKLVPPPPPPRQQPQVPGANLIPNLQSDMLPPGMSLFPPPPPNMRHPLPPPPGIPGQVPPPGVMVPLMPMPPYGPLPGPPPMMRPPLPPGPPPNSQEDAAMRPQVPQKPSYVKSAAPTVVKRPLAQHTPELTAMVPASVRVRRESAAPKTKAKSTSSITAVAHKPAAPVPTKQYSTHSSIAAKTQSIDDSYTAFLEDMKALGALDS